MVLQEERCFYILNLPNPDHSETLRELYNVHASTLCIKLSNSVLQDNILAVYVHSKTQAQEIVKSIDKKTIGDNIIYAVQECALDNTTKPIEYNPIKKYEASEIIEAISNMKNERFLLYNDNSLSEHENTRSGENKEIFRMEAKLFTTSFYGNFLAMNNDNKISIFVATKNGWNIFYEIFIEGVKSMYFTSNETYLIVKCRRITDYTSIYNIFTGKKVFEGIILQNTIKFTENLEYFYFVGTNQVFKNVNYEKSSKNMENLIFKNVTGEKFVLQNEIFGISKFKAFYEFNDVFVLLTDEKLKNIVLFTNGKELIRKNYSNLDSASFYSSKNRMYVVIDRKAGDRNIYSIDSFTSDGKITTNQLDSVFTDVKCSDNAFIAVDDNFKVHFYELKRNGFYLTRVVKKNHKVIISINENGKTSVLYDYDKDLIEFYDSGRLISKYSHPVCTGIEWSCSNLYCVSMSVGLGTSGLLQFYDVNGRFLYKKMFNKLTNFEWKKYVKIEELEKIAEKDYDLYCKDIENEDEDLKKMYETQQKENVEDMINGWIDFITLKRNEIAEYQKMMSTA